LLEVASFPENTSYPRQNLLGYPVISAKLFGNMKERPREDRERVESVRRDTESRESRKSSQSESRPRETRQKEKSQQEQGS
jgi:hypothetical protein